MTPTPSNSLTPTPIPYGVFMSDDNEILIDKFGTGADAPNLSRFDRGGTSLAEVQESLRKRDALNDAQNAALEKRAPVRRD